jgi:endonuclease/exonuclease/phosphatase family metal-dependent hydrolase
VVHPISPRAGLNGLRRREGASALVLEDNAGLRKLQVQAFARAASSAVGPIVVVGDTNLPHLSPLLHDSLDGFADGFQQASWGFGYTFPTNKKWPPWMRIDRILARGPLRFVHFEIGRPVVSDHHFIVADLQRVVIDVARTCAESPASSVASAKGTGTR